MTGLPLQNQIEKIAIETGFDLFGTAAFETLDLEAERLREWIQNGYNAGMAWMSDKLDKRLDARLLFPEVKSVISLGMNYFTAHNHHTSFNEGKISRYAWGNDYHYIMWERTAEFIGKMKLLDPDFSAAAYVDTGPVMDKVWAVKAGLGWLGKNSNVINRNFGSWFFIATLFTNAELEPGIHSADYCGSCTACIDACPTQAITNSRSVDSNKCISYLTIENKGSIDTKFSAQFDDWLFGCDTCQDVCPWNSKVLRETHIADFQPLEGRTALILDEILMMDQAEFKSRFSRSPLKRAKLKGLQRNAQFLKQQS